MKFNKGVQRRLSLLVVIVLLISQPVFAMGPQLDKSHWAYDTMLSLAKEGVFSPMAPDWGLDQPITRQEFVRLVNKAYGNKVESEMSFSDVSVGSPYYGDIAKAVKSGMISGYPDGTFKPMASISRQEAAAVLSKATRKVNVMTSVVNSFSDGSMVPEWSKENLAWVVQKGYMSGYPDGSLGYANPITYGEALAITNNILGETILESVDAGGKTVNGNVSILKPDVSLSNMVINGDLMISGQVGDGDVTLDNVKINGRLMVYGGGDNSIHLFNSIVQQLIVSRFEAPVRIVADNNSSVSDSVVETSSVLEAPPSVSVFKSVIVQPTIVNMAIDLKGTFEDIAVNNIQQQLASAGVESELPVKINIPLGSIIKTLRVATKAEIQGSGEVENADVQVDDVKVNVKTNSFTLGNGVTKVVVNNRTVGSKAEADSAGQVVRGNTGNTNNTGGGSTGGGSSSGGGGDDNDGNTSTPGTIEFSSATYSVVEGNELTLMLNRTNGVSGVVSVNYTINNVTASTSDYNITSTGKLEIGPGLTTKTLTIPTIDDSTIEGDETFSVTLSSPTGGATLGTIKTTTVTITDNDSTSTTSPGAISLTSSSYSVVEGDDVSISVERMDGTDGTVTVDYTVTNGTTDSSDFDATISGTVTFADSEWSKIITVSTAEDSTVESDETFTVTISNPSNGATLGSLTSTEVTITNDDSASTNPGTIAFDSSTASITEGQDATLALSRTGGTDGSVQVSYTVSNTSTDSSDFDAATSGTVTFADGESSKNITVSTADDSAVEGNEVFTVTISNPTNSASLGTITTSTVTITDNDTAQPGTLAFSTATATVNEGSSVTLYVDRTGGTDGIVTVSYTDNVTSGTAIKGTDYTLPGTQTLTFADSDNQETITFTAPSDSDYEGNEVVTISLGTPSNGASVGTISSIAVTIVDVQSSFALSSVTSSGAMTVQADFTDDVQLSTTSSGAISVTSGSGITVTDVQLDSGDSSLVDITFSTAPTAGVAITFTEAILSDEYVQLTTQTWAFDGTNWIKQ